jgi:hypothetical protein
LCGFKNMDTAAHLTADEAHALAAAVVSAADTIDGIESVEGSAQA